MEHQKIINLLDTSDSMPRFNTRKWIEVHDQSGESYNISTQIRFKTMLTDICDYSDAYIVVKGTITVKKVKDREKHNRRLILKNNSPFISCVSKNNETLIDNAEELAVVIPMYNLIEYNKNYWRYLVLYGIITKIFQLIL